MFKFSTKLPNSFPKWLHHVILTWQLESSSCSPSSPPYMYFSLPPSSARVVLPAGGWCVSLWQMIEDKHFLLCSLAIYILAFVKCVFTSFAYFLFIFSFFGCMVCLFTPEWQGFFIPDTCLLSDISAMNIPSQSVA